GCSFDGCTAKSYGKFEGTLYCRAHHYAASHGRPLVQLRSAGTRVKPTQQSAQLLRLPVHKRPSPLEHEAERLRRSPSTGLESGRFAIVLRYRRRRFFEVRVRNASIDYRRRGQSLIGVFRGLALDLDEKSLEETLVVWVRFPAELAALRSR